MGDPGDTLSEFNKVSASACSMRKAHRAEVYDHMRDSNWKSLSAWVCDSLYFIAWIYHYFYSSSNTVQKLLKRPWKACLRPGPLSRLDRVPLQEQIQDWKRQEKQASRHRGDALKIYEVPQEKGP